MWSPKTLKSAIQLIGTRCCEDVIHMIKAGHRKEDALRCTDMMTGSE